MDATGPTPEPDDGLGEAHVAPGRLARLLEERRNDPGLEARWAAWRAENAGAIAVYNKWFEEKGHRYLRKPRF